MTGEGSVLYDVYVLGQAVNELLVDGLADAPLTPSEYAVYSAVFERGPATPSELAPRARHAGPDDERLDRAAA